MIDIKNPKHIPSVEELQEYIRNGLFTEFLSEIKNSTQATLSMEFSRCSWEYGWNVKLRKSGIALCTVYPRENYFTVLVVIGRKEKGLVEPLLPQLTPGIRETYELAKEANEQRWLMIDLEEKGSVYEDVCKLIHIRRQRK